ncbi:transposable element Tcb1 transposase [Trichonephila clavipes]|nr:transposable element Tcb1 transposase [Trichonephila clavipes]
MSARLPLLRLPLTGNHRRLLYQCAMNGGHGQWNGTTLCLLTNPVSGCNITMIELLLWSTCSPNLSPIENVWSMLAQRLVRDTPTTATPDHLWQYVEVTWTAVPQGYIQNLFDSMLRHATVVIANNDGYTNY